ncbi:MAG: type II toxin-antitoxin system RelE/ParE family toxin [Methylococcales bacterium]|nr:type II toxin-antitoxin system RelE/ParE family toxin [Methylococcales bacterium]
MDRLRQEGFNGYAARCKRHFWLGATSSPNRKKTRTTQAIKRVWFSGVLEVVEDSGGGTFRAVYTGKFSDAVHILHCFQKKSKHGIATPKPDMDVIRERFKVAELHFKGEQRQ